MVDDERPFPPGRYPALVIGSGPGGLQVSYALDRAGVDHATISADAGPGGMFRLFPFFQRLLSWTKPYAPAEHGTRAYERYDWNSLLADEPENRSLMPDLMDGSSYFPARSEMEENLRLFAERTGLRVRYDCRWTGTRRDEESDGRPVFVVETSDGEYRADTLIVAVGVAEPHLPAIPGIELASHYAITRSAETYADRQVFIMGKSVSAFELATGLLQWARRIILASPSPTKLSVNTRSLVGVRARYVQPYEDAVLAGGVVLLDASIERVEPAEGGRLAVFTRPADGGPEVRHEIDDVISATGFVCPLVDLESIGVATVGQSRLPIQTPYWESPTVPGLFFAGTIGQGSKGLRKHGLPSNSGAVHGARYNARVMARHIARTRCGVPMTDPAIEPGALVDFAHQELVQAPELWHQRAYLTRVISIDPERGIHDRGIEPLAAFIDEDRDGGDAIALTLEADGTGAIYPVVYARVGGGLEEHVFDADPMADYATPAVRKRLVEIARSLVPDAR